MKILEAISREESKELCRIAGIGTLKASKMLKKWVNAEMLAPDAGKGKRNTRYIRIGGSSMHKQWLTNFKIIVKYVN